MRLRYGHFRLVKWVQISRQCLHTLSVPAAILALILERSPGSRPGGSGCSFAFANHGLNWCFKLPFTEHSCVWLQNVPCVLWSIFLSCSADKPDLSSSQINLLLRSPTPTAFHHTTTSEAHYIRTSFPFLSDLSPPGVKSNLSSPGVLISCRKSNIHRQFFFTCFIGCVHCFRITH